MKKHQQFRETRKYNNVLRLIPKTLAAPVPLHSSLSDFQQKFILQSH